LDWGDRKRGEREPHAKDAKNAKGDTNCTNFHEPRFSRRKMREQREESVQPQRHRDTERNRRDLTTEEEDWDGG
jgi:hypothetical protein